MSQDFKSIPPSQLKHRPYPEQPITCKPKRKGQAGHRGAEPDIEWREYPLIESRDYPAYCRWAKWYRDPGFRRWTCLLHWDVLTDDLLTVIASVPIWLSLGSGEGPWASRRGNYLKEWVRKKYS